MNLTANTGDVVPLTTAFRTLQETCRQLGSLLGRATNVAYAPVPMVADTMRRFGRSGSGQDWTEDGWAIAVAEKRWMAKGYGEMHGGRRSSALGYFLRW